uniref:Uncharacterized protein n=1 Tax=Rousettus aegyptiacus TaxID=9407 RepID=A0A7J8C2G2_ROUAE|nr:hypothetical protein HJG63_009376 [Rousettus aegyptiacus]
MIVIFAPLTRNLLQLEHFNFICCVKLYHLGINSTANNGKSQGLKRWVYFSHIAKIQTQAIQSWHSFSRKASATHILPVSLLLLLLLFCLSPHDHKMAAATLGTAVFTGRKKQVRKAQRNN